MEGRMRTFIFALAAIVPALCAIDRAGPQTDCLPSILPETATKKRQVPILAPATGLGPARKTKQMPKTNWKNAGLSLAHPRRDSASAKAALEASGAMSS